MGFPAAAHRSPAHESSGLGVVHRNRDSRKAKSVITCSYESRPSPDPVEASEEREHFTLKVMETLFQKRQKPIEGHGGYGYRVTGVRIESRVTIVGMSQKKLFAFEWVATLTRCKLEESDVYFEGEGSIVPSTRSLKTSIQCSGMLAAALAKPRLLPGCSRRANHTTSNYLSVDGVIWSIHETYVSAPHTQDPHRMVPDPDPAGFDRTPTLRVV